MTVHVEPDEEFQREGFDLIHHLSVTYPQAALGAKVEVPALEEDEDATETVKSAPAFSRARPWSFAAPAYHASMDGGGAT